MRLSTTSDLKSNFTCSIDIVALALQFVFKKSYKIITYKLWNQAQNKMSIILDVTLKY